VFGNACLKEIAMRVENSVDRNAPVATLFATILADLA